MPFLPFTRATSWRACAILLSSVANIACFAPDPVDEIDPPKYTVVVGPVTPVAPGGSGRLDLFVSRLAGFNEAITIKASTPQAALQWSALTIPAGATEAVLPFTVPSAAGPGSKLVQIHMTAPGHRALSMVASVPVTAAGTFLLTVDGVINVGNPGMTLYRGFRAARNGLTAPITLSVQAEAGITAILPFTQLAAGEELGNVELRIPASTLPGSYSVTLRASSPSVPDQTVTFSVTVTNNTFTLTLDESAVWTQPGTGAQVVASIQRSAGYNNGIAMSATSPAGISVSFTGTSSEIVNVNVDPSVVPGVYPVTITATGPATLPKSAALTVNVQAAAGAATAVQISPPSASIRVDGTQVYTATVLDANGNRVLPAAGNSAEIVTVFSGIANVTSATFHPSQREYRAVVKGFAPGTTDVRAYYRVGGVRVIGPVASSLTVTP